MQTWIFQANPRRYEIMSVLKNGDPIETWSITQHVDEIDPGDRAVLWVGGPNAPGVYAIGGVTGERFTAVIDDPHWRNTEDRMRPRLRCPVHFDTILLGNPIPKADLRSDARFVRSRIITQPFAGNPFRVTDTEWQAIADRLPPLTPRSSLP